MNKIEHIGIAVKDLKAAGSLYEKLLNTSIYKAEEVLTEGVKTAFLQTGPNKIELLEALSADSAIARFIEKKGEGIHHIAFEVDDIVAEMARLKSEGFVLLSDEPKPGADNKMVCFVHPKSAGGVLVELVQEVRRPNLDLDAIVYMKFGYHALEGKHDIISRKKNEFLSCGQMFWGYGGTICHPFNQIQPFAREVASRGGKVFLAMSSTPSKPGMEDKRSLQYATDDSPNWKDIPFGIKVTGSKYAVVCSELKTCDFELNLSDYNIAIGNSKGIKASEYIRFRVDKGCLIKNKHINPQAKDSIVKIELLAELVEPYAVKVL